MWRSSRASPTLSRRVVAHVARLAGAVCLTGLCACAATPPGSTGSPAVAMPERTVAAAERPAAVPQPQAAVAAAAPAGDAPPAALQYLGRFSVTWRESADDVAGQRAIGRFALRVAPARSELEVSSPLGQTLAVATVAPGAASLTTADGRQIRAERPETLTQRAFGWPAPLAELPRWLAAPAGRPQPLAFEDSGWQVAIETWQDGLPRRLVLRWPSPGAQAGSATVREVELRLLVDEALAEAQRP